MRTKLESAFGAEEASILMDRPPGGWSDLVTNLVLAARLDALRSGVVAEIAMIRTEIADVRTCLKDELRGQTWRLSALIFVAFGIVAGLVRAG